ncbi:MAG: putative Fe-Mo cluster-binding NifX family protein [Halobacteriales archaeon]|jgi:predicted Fe-Mo cluster-binding NifX family protein
MKLCIPTTTDRGLAADVSPHFGRAQTFTVYDTETEAVDVVANDGQHHGGTRHPPDIIAETGADIVLCGNLGRKAVSRFEDHGIEVYCDANGSVRDAIDAWEEDALSPAAAENACKGHEGEAQGHSHDHHD